MGRRRWRSAWRLRRRAGAGGRSGWVSCRTRRLPRSPYQLTVRDKLSDWVWRVRWGVGRDAARRIRLCHLRWRVGELAEWEYYIKVGEELLCSPWPLTYLKGRRYVERGLDLAESASMTHVIPHHVFM